MIDFDSNKIKILGKNRFPDFQEPLDTDKAQKYYFSSDVGFSLNNTSQGTGKTRGAVADINRRREKKKESDSIALVTKEHQHAKEEIIQYLDTEIEHRKGLVRWAKENQIDQEKIEKLRKLTQEYGIRAKVAAEIVLGKENGYTEQFEGEKPCVADPLEFLYLPSQEERDCIYVDEDIRGKGNTYAFTFDENNRKLLEIINERYSDALTYDERRIFEKLVNILLKLKSKAREKAPSSQIEGIGDLEEYTDYQEKKGCYRVWKDIELIDFQDLQDLKTLAKINQLSKGRFRANNERLEGDKVSTLIIKLQKKAVKNEDEELLKHLNEFKEGLRCIKDLDSKVTVAEHIKVEDGEIQTRKGHVFGDKSQRAWFYHKKPLFDRLMKLHREGVEVKWLYANLNEKYLQAEYEEYKERAKNQYRKELASEEIGKVFRPSPFRREWVITPPEKLRNRHHYRLKRAFNKLGTILREYQNGEGLIPDLPEKHPLDKPKVYNPELDIPSPQEYEAEITRLNLRYMKSTARHSLINKERWKGVFQNLTPLITKNTGIVTYKDLISPEGNWQGPLMSYLGERLEGRLFEEIRDNIFYFGGGGIQGSNELRKCGKLMVVGTPNKGIKAYMQAYHELYGEWPETDEEGNLDIGREVKGNQLIGYKEEKVDLIYKLEVVNPLIDNLHRLRGLREESKEIILICPPYKELEDFAETERYYSYIANKLDEQGYELEHNDPADKWDLNWKTIRFLTDLQGLTLTTGGSDGKVIDKKKVIRNRIEEDIIEYLEGQEEADMSELKENIKGDSQLITDIAKSLETVSVPESKGFGGTKTVRLE